MKITYRDAVRSALRDALQNDPRVFLMGEDVGRYGGPYACSRGLLEEFGPERIRDTPLSESTFVGAGIGAALGGMRPIVEVMTINFSLLALDQVVNNAAALRHMSGGQFSVPLVVRMATGGGRQLAAQHSHSLEVYYAHVPGIKAVAPATVADARGMLLAALADPDPVFIFENAMLYALDDDIDETAGPAKLEQAVIRLPAATPRPSPMAVRSAKPWRRLSDWRPKGLNWRSSTCGRCGRSTCRQSCNRSPARIAP